MSFYADLKTHERQLEQAERAFRQKPTPALANSIKRLRNAVRNQRRSTH